MITLLKHEVKSSAEIAREAMEIPRDEVMSFESDVGADVIEIYMNKRIRRDLWKLVSMSVVRIDGANQYHFVWEVEKRTPYRSHKGW